MKPNQRKKPDFATMAGATLGAASIIGGLLLEGGSIRDIAQLTAALIVVGGTAGAVLISTPFRTIASAFRSCGKVFVDVPDRCRETLDQILRFSLQARKAGVASLESEAFLLPDPFLRKALGLAVDLVPVPEIRGMMEIELDQEEDRLLTDAKVFETAGGYAPTVGIIGAVLGLIQVMKHLENIDEVGRGIAVSFVATVYGVALANLILLPIAAKLRAQACCIVKSRELALEGVICIVEAVNPLLLRLKMEPYLGNAAVKPREIREPRPAAQRNPELSVG
jgi:chemotaxis protein MotA